MQRVVGLPQDSTELTSVLAEFCSNQSLDTNNNLFRIVCKLGKLNIKWSEFDVKLQTVVCDALVLKYGSTTLRGAYAEAVTVDDSIATVVTALQGCEVSWHELPDAVKRALYFGIERCRPEDNQRLFDIVYSG